MKEGEPFARLIAISSENEIQRGRREGQTGGMEGQPMGQPCRGVD